MDRLIGINTIGDIPAEYQDTPIGLLVEYHNLNRPHNPFNKAQLLIGMCMDNRKHLKIPDNFAFIIRSGGANLRFSEFKVSYAIAVGKVSHLALIGHTNCGMVNLISRKSEFVDGLVNQAGWTKQRASDQFTRYAPLFEIGNEVDFVISEARRLKMEYPKITIAPMMYLVEDNRLYFVSL